MTCWHSSSEEETRRLGAELSERLLPDGTLLLSGDMGVGKTVLVQGLAAGLGLDPADVHSPTFTLVHELWGDDVGLIHIDLYRLDAGEAGAVGLDELLGGPAVKVVEWAEHLPPHLFEGMALRIERLPDGRRKIEAVDPATLAPDD